MGAGGEGGDARWHARYEVQQHRREAAAARELRTALVEGGGVEVRREAQ